jgi:hypothetical protein
MKRDTWPSSVLAAQLGEAIKSFKYLPTGTSYTLGLSTEELRLVHAPSSFSLCIKGSYAVAALSNLSPSPSIPISGLYTRIQ